jgi:hypothetical protein
LPALLRGRVDGRASFSGFATAAIIHDADSDAIMATTRSLPAMIAAAGAHLPGPVHVGPSAIGLFRHPHSPQPLDNRQGRHLPMAGDDPRTGTAFGAAWIIDLLSQCLGAASVTLLADGGSHSLRSDGRLRPAGAALLEVAAIAGGRVLHVDAAREDRIAVLAVEGRRGRTAIVANRSADRLRLDLAKDLLWASLNAGGKAATAVGSVDIGPYGVLVGKEL